MLLTLLQQAGEQQPLPPPTIYQEIWIIEGERPKAKERRKVKKAKKALIEVEKRVEQLREVQVDDSAILLIERQRRAIEAELEVVRAQRDKIEADARLAQQLAAAHRKAKERAEAAIAQAIRRVEEDARMAARAAYEDEQEDYEILYLIMQSL